MKKLLSVLIVAWCGLQIGSAQPSVPAPTPTHPASDVVSLYSDAYTTTGKGIELPTWGNAPAKITIGSNNTLKVANLGTSFAHCTGWKIAGKATIHADVYWESGAGNFSFGFTSGYNADNMLFPNASYTWPALTQGQWVGIDIPTSEWLKLGLESKDLSAFASLQFKGAGTFYVDNIYAYGTLVAESAIPPAPTPKQEASDVVSVFSNHYPSTTKFSPQSWDKVVVAETIALPGTGDQVVKLAGLGDAPIFIDHWRIAEKGIIHIDVYYHSGGDGTFYFGLSNTYSASPIFYPETRPDTKKGEWVSIELSTAEFANSGLDLSDIISVRFRGSGTFYIDNFYAYGKPGDKPAGTNPPTTTDDLPTVNIERAPLAKHLSENVVSVFSDRYVSRTHFTTTDSLFYIQGTKDKVLRLKDLNNSTHTIGIDTWNISSEATIHLDVYYADGGNGNFSIKLANELSGNPDYAPSGYTFPATQKGKWISYEIPASAFASAGLNLEQIKSIGLTASGTFYIDNLYAYTQAVDDGIFKVRTQFGVNMSGGEFGGSPLYPDNEVDWTYYEEKGLNLIRLPFKWERVQAQVGGALSADVPKLKQIVEIANRKGMQVMLDMHNFGRGKANVTDYIIGETSNVTIAHFADVWRKLATEFREYHLWGYDIMNEPHDMGSVDWFDIAQATINAIREVDAETPIVIEGNGWASADRWPDVSNSLKNLVDPSDRLIFQAHCYFDADASGTYKGSYTIEVGNNHQVAITRLSHFVNWLKTNNKIGVIGELGCPGDDERWLTMLDGACAYLKENNVSLTYWSGGRHWGSYAMNIHPDKADMTKERPQMAVLEKYSDFYVPANPQAIEEMKNESTIRLYPNPADTYFKVDASASVKEIKVYNLLGQEIYQSASETEITIAHWAKGQYLVKVQLENNQNLVQKIIKK
ncbi:hypothetical protein FACS189413_06100 [Bacteroidia bacterium]|nr:hypothetical protein FACS189413_06100 [Bacteroidia bacterium]